MAACPQELGQKTSHRRFLYKKNISSSTPKIPDGKSKKPGRGIIQNDNSPYIPGSGKRTIT